jgi:hypothetical protein
MTTYTDNVESTLGGLPVATGARPGCQDCGLPEDATDEQCQRAEESSFSWSPCEACGSTLGGDRHPAHGTFTDDSIVHLDICTDCLFYIANGDEPETKTASDD